jgi:hypothetical protein
MQKGSDINAGKTQGMSEDTLRDVEPAMTESDIIDRPTGNDFWNIYQVERCSV